jgi:O-antigen/teichoic acid export membrane protein
MADKEQFIFSLAAFTLLSSFIGLILLYFLGEPIIQLFFKNSGFLLWPHGVCAILTGITGNMMTPYIFYLRNEQKLQSFLYLNIFLIGLNLASQLIAIYVFNAGFNQLVQTRSAFAVIQFFIMLFIYFSRFTIRVNWPMIKRALSYTIPLIPFLLLNWLQLYYDRFFISHHFGAISLGVFSFVMIINTILNAFTDVFENSFRPSFIDCFINNRGNHIALQNLQNKFLLAIVFSASFILLGAIALPLFTKNNLYLAQSDLFFLIVATGVCKGISLLFIQQLVFREKSITLGIIVLLHFALLWLCYNVFAVNRNIEHVLMINLALHFLITYLYYRSGQAVFHLSFSASQFIIPYGFIAMLAAAYFVLHNNLLSLNSLLIAQFIITAIVYLWFYKKQKLNLSNTPEK